MRLQTRSYKTKPKVVDKKKKDEIKDRKKTLSKDYESLKRYTGEKKTIKIKELTYGIIDSTNLIGIKTDSESLKIENSWTGAIIFMLSMLESLGDFENKLSDYGITNGDLIVDKNYGKIDFSKKYKAFNIYESGYYVELNYRCNVIFEAIVRLTKAIGLEDIQFIIERMDREKVESKKRYNLSIKYFEKKHVNDVIGIVINGNEYLTNNVEGAMTEFVKHLRGNIKSYKSTGIDETGKTYTDRDIRGIKKFINANIGSINIEFIIGIKSEWELD